MVTNDLKQERLKRTLFNFSHAAISIKISNLPNCFSSSDLSCSIFEKDNFIENLYIVLSCLIKYSSFLILFVST